MKTGKNVDEKFKTHLPSMKSTENVDENMKSDLPSTKTAKNVDEKFKPQLPSMKTIENVDENCQNHGQEHARPSGLQTIIRMVRLAVFIKSLIVRDFVLCGWGNSPTLRVVPD